MSDATVRRLAWLVLAGAAALRIAHVLTIRDYPLFEVLTLDAESYDAWARAIAGGELGRGRPFYQAPLYAYFLAGLHRITDFDLLAPRLVNALLGTVLVALVLHVGRRTLGAAPALIGGALVALHGTLLFEEGKVMKTTLGLVLAMSMIGLLVEGRMRGGVRWFAAAGIVGGLTALVRENFVLFVAAAVVWTAWRARAVSARPALALAAGAAAAILPATLHNARWDGELLPITSQAGQNFYTGVHPGNDDGGYHVPGFVRRSPRFEEADFAREARDRTGRALTPGAISRYWMREGLSTLAFDPARFPVLFARKLGLLFNDLEIPDDEDIRFFRRYAPLLRLPGPGFGLIAVLGLIGLAATLRSGRAPELALFVAVYSASVAFFFVFSRYRLPLVGPLAIGAGWTIAETIRAVRARRWRPLAIGLAVAVPLALFVHRPIAGVESFANSHLSLGIALEIQERYDEASTEYRRGLELEPEHAKLLRRAALLEVRRGAEPADRIELLRRALAADPAHVELRFRLATELGAAGDLGAAVAELETILAAGEAPPGIHANLAIAYDRLDRAEAAVRSASLALRRVPGDAAMEEIVRRRTATDR